MNRVVIHTDYENLRHLIEGLPENFDNSGRLLYDKRNQVRVISLPEDKAIVVKRFRKPRIIDKIAYLFGKKSKGEKAYLVGTRLINEKIKTPFPIAFITEKTGLFQRRSYFISTYLPLPSVNDFFERPDFDRNFARRVGSFVAELHSKGIMHGDLNSSNILVDDESFILIDTNRTRFFTPNLKQAARNLIRITTDENHIRAIALGYADSACIDREIFTSLAVNEQRRFRKNKTFRHSLARKLHLRK